MKLPETMNQEMNGTKHPRRSILQMGAAALAGWFAALQSAPATAATVAAAESGTVAPELEGTWLETITFHGEDLPPEARSPFPTFITFARGGGLLTIAGNTPPALENLSFGSWKKVGNKYVYTIMGFIYNAQGVLESYLSGHETLQVSKDRKSFEGVVRAQILDLNLNKIGGEGHGTSHATRIVAEA